MLLKKDLENFTRIVKKIKHPERGLEQGVFDALCSLVTHTACELVIVNNKNEILLTFRKDKFWEGWHFPGGLLRYKESFLARLKLVVKLELKVKLVSAKFLFPINYINSKRGHDVSLVFLCKLEKALKVGKWFKQMPKNIIPEHKMLWKEVIRLLKSKIN